MSRIKKAYQSPDLIIIEVYIESALTAGSARVTPANPEQVILDQWDEESQDRTYTW